MDRRILPPQTAARSPRIEVSERLPFPDEPDGAPSVGAESAVEAARVLASGSFGRLEAEGSAAATAALALGRGDTADPAAAAAALLEAELLPPGADLPSALRAAARGLDEAGRPRDAALLLGLLAGSDEGRADGLLGLAVLAAREGRIDEAFALASDPGLRAHPRAASLLGICELERGNTTLAQAHLAAAARLARRDPALRNEMQIAQRALLLMHLHA